MRKIWLFSKSIDLWLLGFPVWLCWIICFIIPDTYLHQEIPLWFWAVVIVGIDVSHVWSTIFRTYLDKEEFRLHKKTLTLVPLISFPLLFLTAWYSSLLFWTLLAYLALFHFIKQQYGFMQLYKARYGAISIRKRISDKFIIYIGMLYPVLFWHLNSTRNFNWFVNNDFFNFYSFISNFQFFETPLITIINTLGATFYFFAIGLWGIQEIVIAKKHNLVVPFGKILWILTTAFNWYIGIVYFNSDFAFSITNVVAHGIPYLVLLLFYVEKKKSLNHSSRTYFQMAKHIALMILVVVLLAFGEEYFWDMLLYRDNEDFFQKFFNYPLDVLHSPITQAIGFAFLSLPQVTHYILDGVIWKKNKKNPYLSKIIMH